MNYTGSSDFRDRFILLVGHLWVRFALVVARATDDQKSYQTLGNVERALRSLRRR